MNKYFFYKIYHYLFGEKFYKKLIYNFDSKINRTQIIQSTIGKFGYKDYLEIGCDKDQNFSKIRCDSKIGVDPVSGGNMRMTSDKFFGQNTKCFDCIFIDGLHTYDQVKKDILNSLDVLSDLGVIFVHDCMPSSFMQQAVPRARSLWTGDVWKAIVDLRSFDNIDICVCNVDMGLGIIKKRKNQNKLELTIDPKKLKFKDYFYNYKKMLNLIDYEKLHLFLKN
tara:strand:- start:1 stop:669 length:669 start_codon:yes stop_codon:yes gene_type:complete